MNAKAQRETLVASDHFRVDEARTVSSARELLLSHRKWSATAGRSAKLVSCQTTFRRGRVDARFSMPGTDNYRGAGLMTGVRAAEDPSIRAMPES
jgi:hypothetical protein